MHTWKFIWEKKYFVCILWPQIRCKTPLTTTIKSISVWCNCKFVHKDDLHQHLKLHMGKYNFECNLRDKTKSVQWLLKAQKAIYIYCACRWRLEMFRKHLTFIKCCGKTFYTTKQSVPFTEQIKNKIKEQIKFCLTKKKSSGVSRNLTN